MEADSDVSRGEARLSLVAAVLTWTEWRDLLRRAEAAKGVPEKEKVFTNTGLALAWSPSALEVPEADVLMKRAEPYAEGTVPWRLLFLTCGLDMQSDRVE